MRAITVIMKPTAECNLRCRYCYHSTSGYECGRMSEEILEAVISKVQREFNDIMYVWHGGEPLLCGVSFLEKAVALQKKYASDPMCIRNCIQTNGTLLTDEVLDFCEHNHIPVAVSFDGPGALNACRQKTALVEQRLTDAAKRGANVSMLAVINRYNVDHMEEIYRFAREQKIPVKMNPVFQVSKEDHSDYLLDGEHYIRAFKTLFDHWLVDPEAAAQVEPIMQYVKMYFQHRGTECIHGSCLYKWVSVTHDGSIYPCGRFSDHRMGNILEVSGIGEAFAADVYQKLTVDSILRRQYCQKNCDAFEICRGGCNSVCALQGDVTKPEETSCKIFRSCFEHVRDRLEETRSKSCEGANPIIRKLCGL